MDKREIRIKTVSSLEYLNNHMPSTLKLIEEYRDMYIKAGFYSTLNECVRCSTAYITSKSHQSTEECIDCVRRRNHEEG